MSKSVEVVELMTPEERKQALEIDARSSQGIEVGYYLIPEESSLRVEVQPTDDLPFGLRVWEKELGNDVYLHPYAYLGSLAVREAIIDSSLQAA